jgi:C1A family cysteine protease
MKLMRSLLPVTKPVILFLVLVVIVGIAVAIVAPYQLHSGTNTTTPQVSPAGAPAGFSTPGTPEIITPLTSGAATPADTGSAPAPAQAPVNPEFIEYQNHAKQPAAPVAAPVTSPAGTSESTYHVSVAGVIPSPVDLTHNLGQHIGADTVSNSGSYSGSGFGSGSESGLSSEPGSGIQTEGGSYNSTFDLRTFGKVSSVKDQGTSGSCWVFSAVGSLESYFLTSESWDFSENNIKNTLSSANTDGFDRGPNDGGNEVMATAYFTRWSGPVRESDDPYSATSVSSPGGLTPAKHVQNVYFLPDRSGPTDNDNIKYALTHYGGVAATIQDPNNLNYYRSSTHSFYNYDSFSTEHCITLVGWNDTYSRTNFATHPAGDGAFIAKNSWGSAWGESGYFYISYYDKTVGNESVAFTGEPVSNYDREYSYDPLGWTTSIGCGSTTAQYANVFTAQSAETLKAVGFYTPASNTAYVVNVYRTPNSGPINTGGSAATTSGTLSSPGYHTVTVPDVALTPGQKYSIVVSATTPGYSFPIPIEDPETGYSSHATAHAGESYISSNGATWTDLTTISGYANANVGLKGYTKLSQPPHAAGTVINQSATIFIGEQGLDITHALNQAQGSSDINGVPALTRIGWWASAGNVGITAPDKTIQMSGRISSLTVSPQDFVGYTGNWYLLQADGSTPASYTPVFTVADPTLDIRVWNFNTSADVSGTAVPFGTTLGFRIDTNMIVAVNTSYRSPINAATDGYINITVINPSNTTLTRLYTSDPGTGGTGPLVSLNKSFVDVLPYYWGTADQPWKTDARVNGAYVYPEGNYTVSAQSILNHMKDNYRNSGADYTGKTVSPQRIITLVKNVASFTANVTYGIEPVTVQFNDTSAGSITGWNWSFGDGDYSELQDPVHTYISHGNYTVSLNTSDSVSFDFRERPDYINVDWIPSTLPVRVIPAGGTVYIGESGLNITQCMGPNTTIAWFASGAPVLSSTPDQTLDVTGEEYAFPADPANFTGHTGIWYSWADGNTLGNASAAFELADPAIGFSIRDYTTGRDVTGRALPVGDILGFIITDNLANVNNERGVPASGDIIITRSDGTISRMNFPLTSTTVSTGPVWNTGDAGYPAGIYTVNVSCNANQMLVNYPVTGKTLSQDTTVTLSTTPVTVLPAPVITTVQMASGYRNTTVPFAILGSNFEPGPGNTTVEFRNQSTGIIGTTLTGVTTTRIDGTITIPATANTGLWNIRVVTADGGETTRTNAFTVANVSKPTVTAVTPATPWYRNATVNYTVTGTNFQPGNTVVMFQNKSGTVLNTTPVNAGVWLVTPTTIYGTITVPFDAPVNIPWNVSVTSSDGGTGAKENAVTVQQWPAPAITTFTPVTGSRNTTIPFTLTGTGFQTEAGHTNVSFVGYTGFSSVTYYGAMTAVTNTRITGTLSAPPDAPGGVYDITVTTVDGGTATKESAFSILALPPPTITALNQTSGYRNSTVAFTLTGKDFQPGNGTFVRLYSTTNGPLNASLISVTATQAIGTFAIPWDQGPGTYRLDVVTLSGGYTSKLNAFTINTVPKPVITTMSPVIGYANMTISFTLAGTNFQPGGTNVTFWNRTGNTILVPTILSVTSSQVIGSVAIPLNANQSWYVNITTVDGGTVAKEKAFTVGSSVKPGITAVLPATPWYRNATVPFVITGTNFEPGLTTISFSNSSNGVALNITDGWTVNYINATSISGTVVVPYNAPTGLWNVSVTTLDGGQTWKSSAFTVSRFGKPTISTVLPATPWYRNATVPFVITGTNFEPGLTTISFNFPGNGTVLNGTYGFTVNFINATAINGTVVVPINAPTGLWNVSVTTLDGGQTWKSSAFTVARFGKTTFTAITPASGYRNSTVYFNLTGTNFQTGGRTGVTLSRAGAPAELGTTLYSVAPTLISGGIDIPSTAAVGTWNINITTFDGGTTTSPNVFTIARVPVPVITTFLPATAYRGTNVTFTLNGLYFQTGGRSVVNLTNSTGYNITTTLSGVYPTTITGTVSIPADVVPGPWKVNVTTLDGGMGTKTGAVSIL